MENSTCIILIIDHITKHGVCETLRTHHLIRVPMGSPSRGWDVVVYAFDINQPNLPTPFYSVLVSVSVFMTLTTVFRSINSPDISPFSHSVLPVFLLPHWSFNYLPLMKVSFSPDIIFVADWA